MNDNTITKISNPQLWENLITTYGEENCQILDNGVYVANTGLSQVYINSACTNEIPVISAYAGDNSIYDINSNSNPDDSMRVIRQLMTGDNPIPGMVTISNRPQDPNKILTSATSVVEQSGIEITDLVVNTNSASGLTGFNELEQFLLKHENTNASYVGADPYYIEDYPTNTKAINLFTERNVNVFMVGPNGYNGRADVNRLRNFTCSMLKRNPDLNIVLVESSAVSHGDIIIDTQRNNYCLYALGLTDELGNATRTGELSYTFASYVKNSNGYWELVPVDITNYKGNYSSEIFAHNYTDEIEKSIEEKPSEVLSKYFYLNSLEKLSGNYHGHDNDLKNPVIGLNMSFLENTMNIIRTQISNTRALQSFSMQQFSVAGGIPACIASAIESYLSIVGNMLASLEEETQATLSIGQTLLDEDIYNKFGAEALLDAPAVGPVQNVVPLVNKVDSSQTKSLVKNTSTVQIPNKDLKPLQDDSLSRQISKDVATPPNKSNTNLQKTYEMSNSPRINEIQNSSKKVENVLTYEYEDGHKLLINYDGNVVKEMKYQYSFSTSEDAYTNLKFILNKYYGQEYVDKIDLVDKNIDIVFKDTSFNTMTLDEITSLYFLGGKKI